MATVNPLASQLKIRRQAIMLLVLLLIAVGLFIQKRPTPIGAAQDFLIVSMGDSAASGEGNPDVPGSGCDALTIATMQTIFGAGADLYYLLSGNTCLTPPQWLGSPAGTPESTDDKRCHRSQRSGHRLATNAFQTAHPGLAVQFYTVACSGAAIKQYTEPDLAPPPGHGGLIDPYIGDNPTSSQQQQVNWLPSQVDQVQTKFGNRQIDALLINIGVNDVGFGRVVESCLANGFPVPLTFSCPDATLQSAVDLRLTELPGALDQLADQISQKLHVANVYISAYPNPTHSSQSTYCSNQGLPDMVGFLDGGETAWADQHVVTKLNNQIAAAATKHRVDGWHFASGTESSTVFDHGVCNPDVGANNRWFLTMGDSFLTQGDFHGTMHPNAAAHALYASSIKAELEKQFTAPPRPTNLRSNGIRASSIGIQWSGSTTFPETTFQVAMEASTTSTRSAWGFHTVSRGSTGASFNFLFPSMYDFYVRACTTLVCSDWSNGLRVPVTPAAPSNIQGTPFTAQSLSGTGIDDGVTVSWQDNSAVEAGFQIAIRQADLTTYSYATAPAGSTSFGIHHLGSQLRYVVWMRACGLPTECSAWTGDVVVVSGGLVGVVLIPQPPTIQFPAPVSAPPPTLTPLTPAPPPTTAPIPQLLGTSVGVPSLTPNTLSVQTGDQTTLTLNWTVPPPLVWRDLHNVDLRIGDGSGVALLVRFDEQSNTLSVYREAAGKFGPAFVSGSPNKLETTMATLYLENSSVQGSGPTGRSVTLKLSLSFKQPAAGHTFSAEVLATDDSGRTQGFDAVGLVQVQRAER